MTTRTGWILRDGDVLAAAELPARSRAVRGLDSYEGALLLYGTRTVHTVGVRIAIDVALLNEQLVVIGTSRLASYRVALPRRGSRHVLVARAGSFERWGLRLGDRLEVRETP
jgi:uncharacterized protein